MWFYLKKKPPSVIVHLPLLQIDTRKNGTFMMCRSHSGSLIESTAANSVVNKCWFYKTCYLDSYVFHMNSCHADISATNFVPNHSFYTFWFNLGLSDIKQNVSNFHLTNIILFAGYAIDNK